MSKDRVATEATAVSPQINNARRNQLIKYVERLGWTHRSLRMRVMADAMLAQTETDLARVVEVVLDNDPSANN